MWKFMNIYETFPFKGTHCSHQPTSAFTFWTIHLREWHKNIFHSLHFFNMLRRSQNVSRKKLKWFSAFSSASPLTQTFQIANESDKIFQDLLSSYFLCKVSHLYGSNDPLVRHCIIVFTQLNYILAMERTEQIENSMWKLCHLQEKFSVESWDRNLG